MRRPRDEMSPHTRSVLRRALRRAESSLPGGIVAPTSKWGEAALDRNRQARRAAIVATHVAVVTAVHLKIEHSRSAPVLLHRPAPVIAPHRPAPRLLEDDSSTARRVSQSASSSCGPVPIVSAASPAVHQMVRAATRCDGAPRLAWHERLYSGHTKSTRIPPGLPRTVKRPSSRGSLEWRPAGAAIASKPGNSAADSHLPHGQADVVGSSDPSVRSALGSPRDAYGCRTRGRPLHAQAVASSTLLTPHASTRFPMSMSLA